MYNRKNILNITEEFHNFSINEQYVLVPQPNSSIIINEFFVAFFKIDAVSNVSTIKVDTPFSWESPALTLHKIASVIAILAYSQETKQPICANNVINPTYVIYVDLPPILRHAIMRNSLTFVSILTSMAIYIRSF